MRFLKTISLSALLLGMAGAAQAQSLFIENAKIVTNTPVGIVENGTISIENGEVQYIGTGINLPDDATIIDAAGGWVTPGLFAAFTGIGLTEVSLESSTNDSQSNESNTSISEMAVDGFNPNTPVIGNTRVEGITHAAVGMSPGINLFSGTGLIAHMGGSFDSVINEAAFIYAQLGSRGAAIAGGSRPAAMADLRAALDDALAYPDMYRSPDDGDTLSRRDAESLVRVVNGDMPLLIGADRASDILRIIALKDDYPDLEIIIVGAAEGWMVAREMRRAGLKAMIDPHENLPESFDGVGARLDNAVLLDEAGVEFAIIPRSSSTNHNVRVLPQHAGNAVGNGLDWDTAFAAISSVPAKWFGIPEVGRIEANEAANLVIWDGDPLEVTSSPTAVFINGEAQSMESRQTALRDRYGPNADTDMPHKYR